MEEPSKPFSENSHMTAKRAGALVDCPSCSARVFAELIGECEPPVGDDIDLHYKVQLLKCPSCERPIVAEASLGHVGEDPEMEWVYLRRVWPEPEEELNYDLPGDVRLALQEARRCHAAGVSSACAVMVRRVLEAVCQAAGAQGRTLNDQLTHLRTSGAIDARLHEWADELRRQGNLGAHASGTEFSQSQARDLLEFAEAICDYVFVLTKKFEAFRKRTSP